VTANSKSGQPLAKLKTGAQGLVAKISNPAVAGKLMAMGILPGTRIHMVRKAPFGGGCYVKADNLLVALRKTEACSIILS
jgi:ferrous iron transport protein A